MTSAPGMTWSTTSTIGATSTSRPSSSPMYGTVIVHRPIAASVAVPLISAERGVGGAGGASELMANRRYPRGARGRREISRLVYLLKYLLPVCLSQQQREEHRHDR